MAQKTIPQLTEATTIDTNTLLPIDSGIQTYKITAPNLALGLQPFLKSGTWQSTLAYSTNDIVNLNGIFFRALSGSTGVSPVIPYKDAQTFMTKINGTGGFADFSNTTTSFGTALTGTNEQATLTFGITGTSFQVLFLAQSSAGAIKVLIDGVASSSVVGVTRTTAGVDGSTFTIASTTHLDGYTSGADQGVIAKFTGLSAGTHTISLVIERAAKNVSSSAYNCTVMGYYGSATTTWKPIQSQLWSSEAVYKLNDVATVSGIVYTCVLDGAFNLPPATSPLAWESKAVNTKKFALIYGQMIPIVSIGAVASSTISGRNTGTNPFASLAQDGNWLAIGDSNDTSYTEKLQVFKRDGTVWTKLAAITTPGWTTGIINDTTIPVWSPNGTYIACSHTPQPGVVFMFKKANDVVSKITFPALSFSEVPSFLWSPDSRYLIVRGTSVSSLQIFKRAGDTFTAITNPATMPTTTTNGMSVSPCGRYYRINDVSYSKNYGSDTFTANATWGSTLYAWHPSGLYASAGHSTLTGGDLLYKFDGTSFTSTGTILPTGTIYWHPSGDLISILSSTIIRYAFKNGRLTQAETVTSTLGGTPGGLKSFSANGRFVVNRSSNFSSLMHFQPNETDALPSGYIPEISIVVRGDEY